MELIHNQCLGGRDARQQFFELGLFLREFKFLDLITRYTGLILFLSCFNPGSSTFP